MSENKKRLLFWHLVGIGAFNIADYTLTMDFLDLGFTEVNPIIRSLVGTYHFPLVKLMLVPLILVALWQHKDRIGNALATLTWIPFIGYFFLMVYYRILIITL